MPWNPAKPYHPPHIYLDSQVYFVSASTYDRTPLLRDPAAKDIVLKCLQEACQTHGIELDAWAILHEHCHLLFPVKRSAQIVPFIRRFHSTTAIAINKLQGCSGRKVWHNYWNYCPRNDHEWRVVINYIHINPIKHRCFLSLGGGCPESKAESILRQVWYRMRIGYCSRILIQVMYSTNEDLVTRELSKCGSITLYYRRGWEMISDGP